MNVFRSKWLPIAGLVVSIPAAWGVDKDKGRFTPPDIESLQTKQVVQGVMIAAQPFNTETLARTAFGKLNPYQHGILPVLFMVRNDSKKTIRISEMKPEYIDGGRDRIEPTPASEVKYMQGPRRPNMNPSPIPGIRLNRKNPLAAEEIELRAFSAKMLPPGESAHGFLYFQTGHRSGSRLYVTGLQDAGSGQDLFYFDIPLD